MFLEFNILFRVNEVGKHISNCYTDTGFKYLWCKQNLTFDVNNFCTLILFLLVCTIKSETIKIIKVKKCYSLFWTNTIFLRLHYKYNVFQPSC
jgi:hypothetical protein